ncbi:MAG: hypothetical protein WD939_08335 [Dehalococcoidia bacterium]
MTDSLIRPVLAGLSSDQRNAHLRGLQSDCEDKVRALKQRIRQEEVVAEKAAIEYWARSRIFDDPNLTKLADAVRHASAQVRKLRDEISHLHSIARFCGEELARGIASSSRN